MSKLLHGKVAVILGGMGGIGVATAKRFAAAGAAVVVCGQSDIQKAQRVVDSLPGQGHTAKTVIITDSGSLAALANEVRMQIWSGQHSHQHRRFHQTGQTRRP